MNNNVTIINIFSLLAGNNLPWSFRRPELLPNQEETVVQPKSEDGQEGATKGEDKTIVTIASCPWRGFLRQALIVGGIALVLSLWCGCKKERQPEEE